jgi:hypothetical protein
LSYHQIIEFCVAFFDDSSFFFYKNGAGITWIILLFILRFILSRVNFIWTRILLLLILRIFKAGKHFVKDRLCAALRSLSHLLYCIFYILVRASPWYLIWIALNNLGKIEKHARKFFLKIFFIVTQHILIRGEKVPRNIL